MALEKLQIIREKNIGSLDFDYANPIEALFNPNQLSISKSVNLSDQKATQRDAPESQFNHGEPATLNLELFFDTYDTPNPNKDKVTTRYTNRVLSLATVEQIGGSKKHRPPICLLSWGSFGVFFVGLLQSLERQFTLFMEDGTPVRAKVRCTFKQWCSNIQGLQREDLQSSDVAKIRIVKQGESLSQIAAEEYRDPRQWRAIANENGIDDPRLLQPGTVLLIPTLSNW
jgi:nucleoid-associated protein YgaU